MKYQFKFIVQQAGLHTHVGLWAGAKEAGSLGKCGTFVMRSAEWEEFKQALYAGGHVTTVTIEEIPSGR